MKHTLVRAQKFEGKPRIPGDKSISHRGLILGALAKGRTEVVDILEGEDVQSTARCLRALGVKIEKQGRSTFIDGIGERGFTPPAGILDCGNSGTTMRVLMGVLSGYPLHVTLTGDVSLTGRPMKRVAEPLRTMGAKFELTKDNYAPLTIEGGSLRAMDYHLKIASAQMKTAVLMAGLRAEGVTRLTGEIGSRDHTERLLPHFGVKIDVNETEICLVGGQTLQANRVQVPGDPSTAAFWMGAASIIPGAHVEMDGISLNPTRIGCLNALARMGAKISTHTTTLEPEPVGRIEVRSGGLRGIEIPPHEVPSLIDELPLLAVIATQATGTTVVRGAEELRVKESDRIEAVAVNLRAMGAEIETFEDGFRIVGPQKLRGATIATYHDHRIAMAFSVAALVAEGETVIEDSECVAVSYPEFYSTLKGLTQS